MGADSHALSNLDCTAGLETTAEINFRRAIFVRDKFTGLPVSHRHPNLNQTHAAHANRFHLGMVAKDGNIIINPFGSIHNNRSLGNSHLNAIYCQGYIISHVNSNFVSFALS